MNVLITGGASGIGFAIAKAFEKQGDSVHVCDIDPARVGQVNASSHSITAYLADAGSEKDVDAVFDTIASSMDGRLDVLVNNAGVAGPNGPLEQLSADDFNETLRINLVSTFLWSKKAIPLMKSARSGSIVNLSSTAGQFGFPLRTPYAAAKWGVIGLTKSMAMELGSFGIRVNAICPGSVSGPRMDQVIQAEARTRRLEPDDVRRQFERQVSLRQFVEVDDIAQMVLFVCSQRGARISGQALAVDGHTESLAQTSDAHGQNPDLA